MERAELQTGNTESQLGDIVDYRENITAENIGGNLSDISEVSPRESGFLRSDGDKTVAVNNVRSQDVNGDLNISRRANVGGKMIVRGSATFGHNVTIEGWLESPNIRGAVKGVFKDTATLEEVYPLPEDGWAALVISEPDVVVYSAMNQKWSDTGVKYAFNVPVESIEKYIENVEEAVATETSNRIDADTQLGTQISALESKVCNVMSEDSYEKLQTTDKEKFYFLYEDD